MAPTVAVLKPLFILTDALSGEEVTASALRPILKHIMGTHLLTCDEDSVLVSDIKERIKCNLETRYESACVSQLIDKSTFMDPCFKVEYVHDKELTMAEVEAEMLTTLSRASSEEPEATSQANDVTDQQELEPPKKKMRGLGAVLTNILKSNESTKELPKEEEVKKELQFYMDQPCIDTLEWWKLNSSLFPAMAKLAKKYLSIPANSMRSERVFSSGGYIVNNF